MRSFIFSLSIVILTVAALVTLPATYSQSTFTMSSIATTLTIPGVTTVTVSSIATTVTVAGVTTVTISSIPMTFIVSSTMSSTTSGTGTSSTTSSSTSSTTSATSSGTTSTTSSSTTVPAPDFSLSSTPPSLSINQGTSGTATINVNPLNGFSSPVSLTYSWIGTAPSGVTISLPGPVTPSGTPATTTLTVSASSSSSTGSFTLSIIGTSGLLSHTTNVGVLITTPAATTTSSTSSTSSAAGAPVCLIATATYGSQMAPEVQLLRNFRDKSIMKTQAGSSFMIVFNAWYYSFSPGVANYITSHSAERTVMKAVLYPLVGILYLTSNLYSTTASFPELAVLLSGLIAGSLIGAFYLGLPLSLVRLRVRRLRRLVAVEKYLAFTLLAGVTALTVGEALASSSILMISSATIVLSTLVLAALATSSRVANILHH